MVKLSREKKQPQSSSPCNCESSRIGFSSVINPEFNRTPLAGAPLIFTDRESKPVTEIGQLVFKPYFVQKGIGPHLLDWAYASDENWDAFHSNISASNECVKISDCGGQQKFGINVRWNVEGFGYIFITADNGGEFYQLPPVGQSLELNLNFELAKSRVARNQLRKENYEKTGWHPSLELQAYLNLSEELLQDAARSQKDGEKCGAFAQKALFYSMWGGEKLELEFADFMIKHRGYRKDFFLGCDARHFHQMDKDVFLERFLELFNFAHISYVVNGDPYMNVLEPKEGELNFEMRDALFYLLQRHNIPVGGRTIFWFHKWVTPDWLKKKSYNELLKYVEKHTREVIGHYGDGMYAWEIVNELHDWANECELNPEQSVELTRLACEVAKDTAPSVHRLINNCCPFAEYVQLGQWSGQPAKYKQRTPWQFTRDLVEAGVDFDLIGQQMYFPYRDLQDSIMLLERYESFGKRVQVSEIGCPGGPTRETVLTGKYKLPQESYIWHRHWDDELQADWLEGIYRLAYSKSFIEAANWFDLIDAYAYIDNGGLLGSPNARKKAAFHRLLKLKTDWESLPVKK